MTAIKDKSPGHAHCLVMLSKQATANGRRSNAPGQKKTPEAWLESADATQLRLHALATNLTVRSGESGLIDNTSAQVVFVISGAVKLIASTSSKQAQVIGFYFEGDLIYISSEERHACDLLALSDCELLAFPATKFIRLAQTDEVLNSKFLEHLLLALGRCREKSITLGHKTARERVAAFLVSMAERIGQPVSNGALLDLPMSRRDIGDSIGLTIETVSRQMTALRKTGLLSTSGRSLVRILDLKELKHIANHISL